ncbi:ABC transporter ATP-binding protein [Anaerobium acetethylicum]|uniref:ATP-binding cassette, subfamily B/ATP-binding cassette, subfamily B, MsbA n=1 Tax=Anaerobium acetethylicum TaxID=1619234 RepID=A0A1D3TPC1_9FIRM|nr:ABC transporter ATP-binding protein [Anaerobium acetethylicum]SCP95257.1 ATP-binding cassette, subfamily B/ATP-binding cassette, subfamily B, MsbA [Anaerobium acetethylicum]
MTGRKTIKRLWAYAGKYKALFIFVIVAAVLGNTLALVGPLIAGRGIDLMAGTGNVDFKGLLKIVALLAVLYIFSALFQWLLAIFSNRVAYNTIRDIRKDAFEKLEVLPLKYFDSRSHGDIINRMTNDIDAISEGLFQGITQIVSGTVIVLGTFLFMLSISPVITIIVVFVTPVCFLIASFVSKMSQKMFKEQSKTMGELNGYVEEIIGSQKIVRAIGYEERSIDRFGEINARLYECGQKAQWYSSLTNPTTRFINNLSFMAVAVTGGIMALNGRLSVGSIASFISYSGQFAKPINEITSIMTQFQSALASAGRIFGFLDEEAQPEEAGAVELEGFGGNIEFNHVSFGYKPKEPLIKDLTLRVGAGDTVAIVGPTGAGKTTLVNLLMRFYDINDGTILLDGKDTRSFTKDSLRRNIGMVLQDTWLFQGTIAENIAYGKPDSSREEIMNAAKSAHAHDFIKKMQDGYDTEVEEDGRNLSAGQKQLLTIARVMLASPPMLVLDEATSSIDSRTEMYIQKAFREIMKGRTSFVIAHRLSTIREADMILVMNYGQIVEQGRHEELIAKKGFYYKLYSSQFDNR